MGESSLQPQRHEPAAGVAQCAAHGLHYDAARTDGCVLCRKRSPRVSTNLAAWAPRTAKLLAAAAALCCSAAALVPVSFPGVALHIGLPRKGTARPRCTRHRPGSPGRSSTKARLRALGDSFRRSVRPHRSDRNVLPVKR